LDRSGTSSIQKDFYYVLLKYGGGGFDDPKHLQERWWVWDLEAGKMGYDEDYSMPFDAEKNGDWKCPYYRLIADVPEENT
jgi:hypothetical protein